MKYFVSYTRRDAEITLNLLKAFAKELEKRGDVFIDIINNNSTDKQKRVIDELDNCDMLLLLETKNVYKSLWVAFEIDRAKSKKIPIRVITLNRNHDGNSISQLILRVVNN
jgi:hypothetical protein